MEFKGKEGKNFKMEYVKEFETEKQKQILKKKISTMFFFYIWDEKFIYKDNVTIQQFVQLFHHFHRLAVDNGTLEEITHAHQQCALIVDAMKKEIDFIKRAAIVEDINKEINPPASSKRKLIQNQKVFAQQGEQGEQGEQVQRSKRKFNLINFSLGDQKKIKINCQVK